MAHKKEVRITPINVLSDRDVCNTASSLVEESRELISHRSAIAANLGLSEATSVSSFNLLGRTVYSASSQLSTESKLLCGNGRSESAIIAAAKAFAENLERLFAFQIMSDPTYYDGQPFGLQFQDGNLRVNGKSNEEPPPRKLRTSTGWSIHHEISAAVNNSVAEAVERSMLQALFYGLGWSGFNRQKQIEVLGHRISCWISTLSMEAWNSVIIECLMPGRNGRTFGYGVLRSGDAEGSITNAVFEALEPALFFESNANYRPNPNDVISKLQFQFAEEFTADRYNPEKKSEVRIPNFSGSVMVYRVDGLDESSPPLYLAWVFGGVVLPLALPIEFDQVSLTYLRDKFNKYGVEFDPRFISPVI